MPEHKQQEKWVDEFYSLYRKGRKSGAPQSYIDYFEARRFISSLLSTIKSEVDALKIEERKTDSKRLGFEKKARNHAIQQVINIIEKHQNEG